jgi:hypothetical protein
MAMANDDESIPRLWILLFLLLTLGIGLVSVQFVGGSVLPTVVPLPA